MLPASGVPALVTASHYQPHVLEESRGLPGPHGFCCRKDRSSHCVQQLLVVGNVTIKSSKPVKGAGWSREGCTIPLQAAPCWEAGCYHEGQKTRTCFWRQGVRAEPHLPHALPNLFRGDNSSGLHISNAGS